MNVPNEILRNDEKLMFDLRALYSKCGYEAYRMSRFEEYELYNANRAFLPDGDIIAFTGAGGKLMALRPDVTLSIVKNTKDNGQLKKLYYNENVYRTVEGELKEQMQTGLECIGEISAAEAGEVLMLAKQSLDILGKKTRLDISHVGFLNGLLASGNFTAKQRAEAILCISGKNVCDLKLLCESAGINDGLCEKLIKLTSVYGTYLKVKEELGKISVNNETDAALAELERLDSVLQSLGIARGVNIDFSVTGDITYYSSVIFQGFIEGVPQKVLSGGRYDELMRNFGRKEGAIGFAVYLDLACTVGSDAAASGSAATDMLGVALPKGRLGEKAYEIFKKAGYECRDMSDDSRKLVFESPELGIRYFWVKPSDVAIYVERGVADIGVVGKDTLLEKRRDVYELLDLGIGKCRMCVAAEKGFAHDHIDKPLKVATKFPNIARRHYRSCGSDIDIIKLQGSIELAPLLGLSDVIVDLVETGKTLKDNNMEPVEIITEISARLISNKTSYKFKHDKIIKLCEQVVKYE